MIRMQLSKVVLFLFCVAGLSASEVRAASTDTVTATVAEILAAPAQYDQAMVEVSGMVWVSSTVYNDGYALSTLTIVNPSDFDTIEKSIASMAAGKYIRAFIWGKWNYERYVNVKVVGTFDVLLPTRGGDQPNAIKGIKAKKSVM